MTSAPRHTEGGGQEKAAAVGFVAFMGLALGPLGALVAAFAVGIERAWGGGAEERLRARERGRGWLGEQRDWLAADHRQRESHRQKRRDWLASGADPETEPAKPGASRRFRNSVRRGLANVVLGADDFEAGAQDGWKAAQETRRNGGGFRDIATSHPEDCTSCRRARVPVVADGLCEDCSQATRRSPHPDESRPTPKAPVVGPKHLHNFQYTCPDCDERVDGFGSEEDALAALNTHRRDHWKQPAAGGVNAAPNPSRVDEQRARDPRQASAAATAGTSQPVRCGRCGGPLSESRQAAGHSYFTTRGWMFCPSCDGAHSTPPRREFCGRCFTAGYPVVVVPQPPSGLPTNQLRTFIHEMTGTNLCPPDDQAQAWHDRLDQMRQEDRQQAEDTPNQKIQAWLDPRNRKVEPATQPRTNQKETSMSQPSQASPSTQAPATESNATVLRQKLVATKGTLNRVAELTDQLAAERSTLGHQVRDASEFATSTGQSAQAQQALDESNALAASMGEHLGNFSQGAVSAEASVSQASEGLRVAENAEDALRSAGADGRAVAPAGGANA